jgi:hypothetical protein
MCWLGALGDRTLHCPFTGEAAQVGAGALTEKSCRCTIFPSGSIKSRFDRERR